MTYRENQYKETKPFDGITVDSVTKKRAKKLASIRRQAREATLANIKLVTLAKEIEKSLVDRGGYMGDPSQHLELNPALGSDLDFVFFKEVAFVVGEFLENNGFIVNVKGSRLFVTYPKEETDD